MRVGDSSTSGRFLFPVVARPARPTLAGCSQRQSSAMSLTFAQLPRLGIQFGHDSSADPSIQVKAWAERLERQWKHEKEPVPKLWTWRNSGAQTQRVTTAPSGLSLSPHRPLSTRSHVLDASWRGRWPGVPRRMASSAPGVTRGFTPGTSGEAAHPRRRRRAHAP